jgi:DNA-binding NtrC family response regulator
MKRTLRTVCILSSDEDFKRDTTLCLIERNCVAKMLRKTSDVVLSVLEEDVDLVILDADCNDLNSLVTTVKIIEKCRPRIPIVVATSDQSVLSGAQILHEGIFYYLIKPSSLEEFGEVVTGAIRKKESLDRNLKGDRL